MPRPRPIFSFKIREIFFSKSYLQTGMDQFERKMSIFERALSLNPNSFRLKLERIKLKANSLEMLNIDMYNSLDLIRNEFTSLLASESSHLMEMKLSNISSFNAILAKLLEIWLELINFLLSNNSSNVFFEKIRKAFTDCFGFFTNNPSTPLQSILSHFLTTSDFFASILIELVDVYTRVLCQFGYVEKCVGIYQALLDFNLYSDEQLDDLKSKIPIFELYWDIGLPKFGENLSKGWLNCLDQREAVFKSMESCSEPTLRNEDALDDIESQVLGKKSERIEFRWLKMEHGRSLLNWYPFYPRVVIGESADDCADPDRLVLFEDDIKFCLFNVRSEFLKFKLLLKFMKQFGVFKMEEECTDIKSSDVEINLNLVSANGGETNDFLGFLNEKLNFFAFNSARKQEVPFFGKFNYLQTLYVNYFNSGSGKDLEAMLRQSIKHFVDFIRNSLNQSLDCFNSQKVKTYLIVLKWRFELEILYQLSKSNAKLTNESTAEFDQYFNSNLIKQNLLNSARVDLSSELNRSNFSLWKQYGHLKHLLNCHPQFSQSNSRQMKETRKIFDTLLTTSTSAVESDAQSCINIYSLCVDYVLIELNAYYRLFDVNTSLFRPGSETSVGLSTFFSEIELFTSLKSNSKQKREYEQLKEKLSEILTKNCLTKSKILKLVC